MRREEEANRLGEFIRQKRLDREWTQAQLIERLQGINPDRWGALTEGVVSHWERGERLPGRPGKYTTEQALRDFAEVFALSITEREQMLQRAGFITSLLAPDTLPRLNSALQNILQEVERMRKGIELLTGQGHFFTSQRTPKEFLQGGEEEELSDQPIKLHDYVVALFQQEPSFKWRDPAAELIGLWDAKHRKLFRLERPPKVVLPDSSVEPYTEPTSLCIPGYDVDVEWREETHVVYDPLWRSVKLYAVSNFLRACQDRKMICQVIYVGRKEDKVAFHLHSGDYDAFLNCEWFYYKGLETALAKNRLYKHPEIINMLEREKDFRHFVAENLINTGALEKMIPERYRQGLEGRRLDPEGVFLVLRGLVERYLMFKNRHFFQESAAA